MESIFRKGRVECLVNPMLGREKEMEFRPAKEARKVMVVGGGPGGLNVAWVAARRGHEVHLFEKEPFLGGQLVLGSVSGYKKEILNLIRFQKSQIEKYGVQCHLNQKATLETVLSQKPDVIVLATGSVPTMPPIEGIEKDIVVPIAEVLNGAQPAPKKTAVIGGGPTGCEVALHLAEHGCGVVLIEMLSKIGNRLETMTRKIFLEKLKEFGVQMLADTRLLRVEDRGVTVADKDGNERFLDVERVVVTTGNRPDNALYEQLKPLGCEIHQIGDCLEPRSAKAAIYEGAVLGRAI